MTTEDQMRLVLRVRIVLVVEIVEIAYFVETVYILLWSSLHLFGPSIAQQA